MSVREIERERGREKKERPVGQHYYRYDPVSKVG